MALKQRPSCWGTLARTRKPGRAGPSRPRSFVPKLETLEERMASALLPGYRDSKGFIL